MRSITPTPGVAFEPWVADTEVGASGAVAGAASVFDVAGVPGPTELLGVTVKLYLLPGINPVTVVSAPVVDRPSQVPGHAGLGEIV